MNAIVAKRDADAWPAAITDERQELPGFWTFSIQGQGRFSAHRGPTATIGGQTRRLWLVHAPRAALRRLRDIDGLYVRTMAECMASGALDDVAARLGWPYWFVDGTLTGAPVTSWPWRFAGPVQVGTDGAMLVTALVRPRTGEEVLGDPEDYDGAEVAL